MLRSLSENHRWGNKLWFPVSFLHCLYLKLTADALFAWRTLEVPSFFASRVVDHVFPARSPFFLTRPARRIRLPLAIGSFGTKKRKILRVGGAPGVLIPLWKLFDPELKFRKVLAFGGLNVTNSLGTLEECFGYNFCISK